ncbi:Gfo/Idh/MocA family protein [Halobacterium litoreum]|uniref:Gfo/Idh/MocA family protein n=1 Tax=Halobacterium litoreum TaxID=2039234 RepID=A0ABD5NCT6_9EURY|nr:Gfo/Idh/MocA family oxidoreductase [Halobacterium litoreum]UHH14251.1 Gfo/Idh/MocA family oxidoreductase [Halobacterium litoreum]
MQFGIISTAHIADAAVVPAIRDSDHEVRAVASRSADDAAAFADRHDIPESYGSYDELLDADVDAVYNPLPNALHAEWTCRAADAGLDVLCEKPLASDADEAVEVVQHCRNAGVTLMSAFMYRYHPRTERAIDVAENHLGDLRHVHAAFNFPLPRGRDDVRLDPSLAGGALMDVGCYAVSAARQFLGEPVAADASVNDARNSGVDTDIAGTLEFADGATATVEASFETRNHQTYRVEGTDGWLEAERAYNPGDGETVLRWGTGEKTVEETFDPTDAYRLEVEHFADCVASGESPRTDGEEAVANMRAIDALYDAARTDGSVPV